MTSPSTLVVIGCGPGIGLATAKLFAAKAFTHVALLSRNSTRLESDRSAVLSAAHEAGNSEIKVKTWSIDINQSDQLRQALSQVQSFGRVSCVLFNAARVQPSTLFEFDESEMIKDFQTTNIGLYTTAQWAIPLLHQSELERNALLVTSGLLWREPQAEVFSLSMVKTSQRNLVQMLQQVYPDVHIAMLHVSGEVSPESDTVSPDKIAGKFWDLYMQSKGHWDNEATI